MMNTNFKIEEIPSYLSIIKSENFRRKRDRGNNLK